MYIFFMIFAGRSELVRQIGNFYYPHRLCWFITSFRSPLLRFSFFGAGVSRSFAIVALLLGCNKIYCSFVDFAHSLAQAGWLSPYHPILPNPKNPETPSISIPGRSFLIACRFWLTSADCTCLSGNFFSTLCSRYLLPAGFLFWPQNCNFCNGHCMLNAKDLTALDPESKRAKNGNGFGAGPSIMSAFAYNLFPPAV